MAQRRRVRDRAGGAQPLNQLRTDRTEPGVLHGNGAAQLNIEHLLPQKWETHWPLEADADEERIRRRGDAVHQLGNLTLTTTKLNPSLSNQGWSEKKDGLRRHSLLRLTTASVLTVPDELRRSSHWDSDTWAADWNETRIGLRTMCLARQALRAWPGVDVISKGNKEPDAE
ncbi:HNH endonuclease family protein [Streptomyces sp. 8N706]|uniref:HNH endonuclease family protein n=1 Tax=Streptomyces sp. 8N706 TaxID=3457416 RepID=UPI003FD5733F